MANIVEIVIRGVDKTKEGFNGAIKNLGDLEKSIGKVAPLFAAVGATAATAFVAAAKHFINVADEAGKTAQKVGESTESFTAFRYAAEQSNVSGEQFATGLRFLNKSISENSTALQELGISATDASGKVRSSTDVMLEVADKFSKTADGANKTAAAMAIFGKSGADMIPMLNEGREGLLALTGEARAFGVVVTDDTSKSADEFNDNLSRLKTMLSGLVATVVSEFLPSMAAFTTRLIEAIKQSGILAGAIWTLVDVFKAAIFVSAAVVRGFEAIYNVFTYVGNRLGEFVATAVSGFELIMNAATAMAASVSLALEGEFGAAREAAKAAWTGIKSDFQVFSESFKVPGQNIKNDLQKIWEDLAKPLPDVIFFSQGNKERPQGITPSEQKPELGFNSADSQKEAIALAQKEMELLRKQADIQARLFADGLTGSQALLFAEEQRYQKIAEQIDRAGFNEDEYHDARAEAYANYQKRITALHEEGLLARAELDTAFKAGDVQRSLEFYQSEAALRQADLAGRQEFISAYGQMYMESHRTMFSYVAEATQRVYGGLSTAITNVIMGVQSAGEAFKQLGISMVQMVVQFIMQRLVAFAMEKAMAATGLAMLKASALASASTAASLAAAWTPAATAATIATFGAASAFGATVPTVMAANTAAATTMALASGLVGGVAHGGLDYVPAESTFLLQRGERVIQPKANEDLTEFLNGSGGARKQIQVQIFMDSRMLGETVAEMSKDGRLQIDARAIV